MIWRKRAAETARIHAVNEKQEHLTRIIYDGTGALDRKRGFGRPRRTRVDDNNKKSIEKKYLRSATTQADHDLATGCPSHSDCPRRLIQIVARHDWPI